jgi:hypothetical protein
LTYEECVYNLTQFALDPVEEQPNDAVEDELEEEKFDITSALIGVDPVI